MDFNHTDSTSTETEPVSSGGVIRKFIPSAALGAGVIALIVLLTFAF